MTIVKCPHCSRDLAGQELNDGWCDSCGKQLPTFVYHEAGLKGPKGHALPQEVASPIRTPATLDPEEQLPLWQLAGIGLTVLVIAAVIMYALV